MNARHETHMSTEERLAVLETVAININATLLDIRQEMRNNNFEMKQFITAKFEAVDKRFEAVDKRFETMDKKFETKLETIDKKFEAKFEILHNRLWSNFLYLMSGMIGLAGLIAHTQHWI